MRDLVIDSFAGGGGASEGIRAALAEALVAANYREAEARPPLRPAPDLPLFAAE